MPLVLLNCSIVQNKDHLRMFYSCSRNALHSPQASDDTKETGCEYVFLSYNVTVSLIHVEG